MQVGLDRERSSRDKPTLLDAQRAVQQYRGR
jgi:hypothetical protein